jgi:hypothetical protein
MTARYMQKLLSLKNPHNTKMRRRSFFVDLLFKINMFVTFLSEYLIVVIFIISSVWLK